MCQDAYLEICRCYKAIAAMPSVAADAPRAAGVLRKICWFVVLAPTSSDQARRAWAGLLGLVGTGLAHVCVGLPAALERAVFGVEQRCWNSLCFYQAWIDG